MSRRDVPFREMLQRALEREKERTREMILGKEASEQGVELPRDQPLPLWRLFKRYYLQSHFKTVVISCILAAVSGMFIFVYTFAGKIIADDIVEVGLLTHDNTDATRLDPVLVEESVVFQLDEPRPRTSLTTQLDERPGKSREEKLKLLAWMAVALLLMEALRHLVQYVTFERTVYMTQKVQFVLRQHIHNKLNALPMEYHDAHAPGRLMTHLFSDMRVISTTLTAFLRIFPESIFGVIVGLCIIFYVDFTMACVVAMALPAYAVANRWFGRYQRVLMRDLREREGKLNAHIANRVSHFQVVKAYGRETLEAISFLRRVKPILRQNIGVAMFNTAFNVTCSIISLSSVGVVLWMSVVKVKEGTMTPGELLMFWGAANHLFAPISRLTSQAGAFYKVNAVAAKVMRVLDEKVTLDDPENPTRPPKTAPEVQLDNVSYKYSDDSPYVLKDLNFTIPAGQRLCVMGPSGSGKTTLAKMICRFYDPTEGNIFFNKIDYRQFTIADLRDLVGYVSQEPIVFSGTIAENIRYGTETADQRSIIRSAQYAQIHEHIEQLPAKYRTLTQERGLTLSGGQKQRVNLARTLMQDNRFLVLDDCTSALDADTEARLIDALKNVLHEKTALLVSHRVSVAMSCDLVLMLDEGEIVEYGNPRELINSDGAFAAVHQKQLEKAKQAESDAVAAAGLRIAGAKS